MAEAASKTERMLAHQLGAGDGFSRAMAHDLSNLIGVIIGNLDLLNERPDLDAETKELARECLDAALKSVMLIQQLRAARREPNATGF